MPFPKLATALFAASLVLSSGAATAPSIATKNGIVTVTGKDDVCLEAGGQRSCIASQLKDVGGGKCSFSPRMIFLAARAAIALRGAFAIAPARAASTGSRIRAGGGVHGTYCRAAALVPPRCPPRADERHERRHRRWR